MNETTKASIDLYAKEHIQPGSFLLAVLSNDLFDAMGRADCVSRIELFEIVKYINNHIPSNCWGSRDKVMKWLNRS